MQRLEVCGAVRPIYGSLVRQTVKHVDLQLCTAAYLSSSQTILMQCSSIHFSSVQRLCLLLSFSLYPYRKFVHRLSAFIYYLLTYSMEQNLSWEA